MLETQGHKVGCAFSGCTCGRVAEHRDAGLEASKLLRGEPVHKEGCTMKTIKKYLRYLYPKAFAAKALAWLKKHWLALVIGYGVGAGWVGFLWSLTKR
jgi:hypothetical protein